MLASCCAHSAKKGTSTPSASPATKNRNRPTSAGRGMARSNAKVDEKYLRMVFTSKLLAAAHQPARHAIGLWTDALADVNAYGGRGAALTGHLRHGRRVGKRGRHG